MKNPGTSPKTKKERFPLGGGNDKLIREIDYVVNSIGA